MSRPTKFNPAGQCVGKNAHASYLDARAEARKARRHRGSKRARCGLEPYRCPHCRHWHVGQPPRFIAKGRRLEDVISEPF